MKKFNLLAALLTIITLWSCSGSESTLDRIARDFENRRAELARPELYAIFDTTMTGDERRAMEFLYAYMPLPDMTDYTGRFYLDNVKATLKAREEMPWGNSVPEREFRHFVLPVRVNNENLDSSRMVFYAELKDRVKDLSMSDAILEINHWCHEKVTYRPSDSRTSSPLASVRTAYGRCGEESTFTVAALRSMGIPARQVYTPRWAHTDDNHAWVEAWADGKWYFLGACEPEPILNLGWFNAPASRGMMMNTKVLGAYDGPEEQLDRNSCYTEINVTANYAPVAQSVVTVLDSDNNPVEGALVEFKLYNYGEFYSIARKMTDAQGKATITTGLGDMLAWASKDERFGFSKLTATADGGTATVTLDMNADTNGTWEFDMVPPVQSASLPTPTAQQIEENNKRLATEDSIRKAYTSTFMNRADGEQVAKSTDGFASYTARIADRLVLAEGNHTEIERFIRQHPGDTVAIGLLESVAEKDLKDVTCDILSDHIAMPRINNPLYVPYIVNPRIDREMLTAFRSQLRDRIKCNPAPAEWIKWCADSIEIDTRWNPQWLRMSPVAVYD
ncbi:MAG: transglutaminase domain-containing protein, partial [Muribaculaceae bacterium]|nr:transglutaminase domain-containing protein [Muribaculaceae bacterium]